MTEADVREMVSVICALEMDSDTFSAIQFMMKMITTSASRNLSPRNGVESLRDISEKKNGNQYLYRVKLTYQARLFNFFLLLLSLARLDK